MAPTEIQKTAKQQRISAKGLFTRSLKSFKKAIGTPKDIILIGNKFKDLERCWQTLREKHEAYLATLEETDEETLEESSKWIEGMENDYEVAELDWYTF